TLCPDGLAELGYGVDSLIGEPLHGRISGLPVSSPPEIEQRAQGLLCRVQLGGVKVAEVGCGCVQDLNSVDDVGEVVDNGQHGDEQCHRISPSRRPGSRLSALVWCRIS